MLPSHVYRVENIPRVRYARIAAAILATLVCAYCAYHVLSEVTSVWTARRTLAQENKKWRSLADEAKLLSHANRADTLVRGGIDSFAAQVAARASAESIVVESISPEGRAAASEVKVENESLGQWKACRVKLRGRGQYNQVMLFLEDLRNPGIPVQVESFDIQAANGGIDGSVTFELLVTVYESEEKSG